jgi:heme/copper-type cytochrome/quinol oxidase subunit 1
MRTPRAPSDHSHLNRGGSVSSIWSFRGANLWQHLFWFFGHPEVYIVALPYFGIVSEIITVFSRKPLFGYKAMVFATLAITFLSMTVWAHHMFVTSTVLLPFFSFVTFLIAVPTGVKFFNWILTMWRGQLTFESPMFGTIVFATFAGICLWFPKITGRYLDEPPAKLHFWTTFLGFHTFLVHHRLGDGPGHAAALRRLPAQRRVHHPQHDLHRRRLPARSLGAAVHLERVPELPLRPDRRRRRSVGSRQLAGMGDHQSTTSAQLP